MSGRVGSITTDIIADGLVFNMDAANRASYPKTGPTAHNTINAVNSGSFQDDTSFSTDQGGAFNFDGVDDYIQVDPPIPQATTAITINVWFKGTAQGSNSGGNYLFGGNPGYNHGPGLSYDYDNERIGWGVYTNGTYNQATGFTQDTIWNVCSTFNRPTLKTYKNGVLADTDTQNTNVTYQNNTSGNRIGEWGYASYQRNFNGQIYLVQVYNRELSATEVLHNYNALKYRMGYVAPLIVSFLVVAGGGSSAGGSSQGIGGSGAGGLRTSFGSTSGGGASAEDDITLEPGTSYTVTVGAGGASTTGVNGGNNGNDSVFATITSLGGGNGGSGNISNAGDGGSGGGSGRSFTAVGEGTTGQGFDGGDPLPHGPTYVGGGGGGAAAAGTDGPAGGDGGAGLSISITGTSVTYAGGGGGGSYSGTPGDGGIGGGGDGGIRNGRAPTAGTANTGGGGGAARGTGVIADRASGAGGSGVVILRYPSSNSLTVGAGLTSTTSTDGTFKVTTFTAGTDTISFS